MLNIIFDDRMNWDDKERLIAEFEQQGIYDYTFWDAVIDRKTVTESINASHKRIVEWAKENGLLEVMIAEQDLTFTNPNAWEYFLNNKPEDFDIYLAATYIPPITNNKICGFHLYIVRQQFYDKFLSVDDRKHIDTGVCEMGGNFKFCYPFPALQRSGYSANNGTVVNYNSLLKPEDIYK